MIEATVFAFKNVWLGLGTMTSSAKTTRLHADTSVNPANSRIGGLPRDGQPELHAPAHCFIFGNQAQHISIAHATPHNTLP